MTVPPSATRAVGGNGAEAADALAKGRGDALAGADVAVHPRLRARRERACRWCEHISCPRSPNIRSTKCLDWFIVTRAHAPRRTEELGVMVAAVAEGGERRGPDRRLRRGVRRRRRRQQPGRVGDARRRHAVREHQHRRGRQAQRRREDVRPA